MPETAQDAVAIIGLGGIFPGAATIGDYWQNIHNGTDAITDVPAGRWDPIFFDPDSGSADRFYCRRGGFVDDVATFDPTAFGIMPVTVEGAEPDQLLALGAAAAALSDAADAHHRVSPERIGVILGRGGYLNAGVARLDQRVRGAQQLVEALRGLLPDLDEATLRRVKDDFQSRLAPERPEASIGLVPNLAASRIANRLDFQGPAYTVDAACASALIAVDRGIGELRSGRCDLMVVGGVHHCHDLTLWSVFTQLKALSTAQTIRPFSNDADGILVGEGTGMFVLKRLADAERDDDRIYAVIRGSGVASDGRDASLMSPRPEGQVLAVRQAWQASGLDPTTVGLIEAHGTATRVGDAAELETLRSVFGPADPKRQRAGLGSVKSMIGHAMPAAGAAGLAKAAMAIFHHELPPTLHVEDPNPAVAATNFRLIESAEPWLSDGPRRAGVNAFGFGGINAHLVIEEHGSNRARPTAVPARSLVAHSPDPERILTLAGVDAADVLRQLETWQESDGGTDGSDPTDTARLAIVDPTPKRLALAHKVLERGTAFRGRNDVWFEPAGLVSRGGKVAYLFPGVEPDFSPRVDDVAAHFSLPGLPPSENRPDLEAQSLGIIAMGRMLTEALRQMGVTPDVIAGHSLGEWTGQIVSGMIPTAFIDQFLEKLRPGSINVSDVVFIALGCGADTAEALLDGLDDAYLSHDNCLHQSVVCTREDLVDAVLQRARQQRVFAQQLPFRSGFHSPLFEPFVQGLATQFAAMPIDVPHTALWSATACAPYPEAPESVAELSLRHLVEPVRFRSLTEALYDAGVRVFVQVGSGSLGAFVDDTMHGRDVLVVATNVPKLSGLAQLRRAAAALWVEGVDVDFSALSPSPVDREKHTDHPGRARPLQLGTHLVRGLQPLAHNGSFGVPESAVPAGAPAIADFRLALDEATAAARAVLDAAATRSRGSVPQTRTAAPLTTPSSPRAQPNSLDVIHHLSVDQEPAWRDHAFFPQPDGWPHLEDTFPLVPMTGILAMFVDAARQLVPDHVAISVEAIRAFQWLAVTPPVDVTVHAVIDPDAPGPGIVVNTSIDRHAKASVRLTRSYPTAPPPTDPELRGTVEASTTVDRVYADGHLFHGPSYQGMRSFDHFATNGARGRLVSRPAPGALLDNAGQLFGYWVACALPEDRLVLPTSIDRISFFGDHPTDGTDVDAVVEVTDIEARSVRCNIDLTVDGMLWCRIEGWEDRRFQTNDRLFDLLRNPSELALAEQRGEWVLVTEAWPDSATRDVVRRRYLGRGERDDYDSRNPNAQRTWLLGRIAAKDAVRLHLWDHGAGPLFQVELTVENLESGQPIIKGDCTEGLHISIAHTGPFGVAIVGDNTPVGIDIEAVEARSESFERTSLTASEIAHIAALTGVDRNRETTRLWAAKEAAAKADGTGFGGRPRDFSCTGIDADTMHVGTHRIATTIIGPPPGAQDHKEYVVAWTVTDH